MSNITKLSSIRRVLLGLQQSSIYKASAGLQLDLDPSMQSMPTQYAPDGSLAPRFDEVPHDANRTTTGTISSQVEMLRMNTLAVWITTSIFIWLLITLITFALVQWRYHGGMLRSIECIADVLILIAGSERLLAIIERQGIDADLRKQYSHSLRLVYGP